MSDYNQCREQPITSPKQREAIRMLRTTPRFVFVPKQDPPAAPPRQLADPTIVFQVAFNRQVDGRIVRRIRELFEKKKRDLAQYGEAASGDDPGYIYCFHDIGDRPDVLKIGRTKRTPEERLVEWENDLSPEVGQSLIILCAYPTECNKFAEDIFKALLACRQIHNRINPHTGAELTEFFTIDNAMATNIFIRETLRFINDFWRRAAGR